jgi:hypothetical protein
MFSSFRGCLPGETFMTLRSRFAFASVSSPHGSAPRHVQMSRFPCGLGRSLTLLWDLCRLWLRPSCRALKLSCPSQRVRRKQNLREGRGVCSMNMSPRATSVPHSTRAVKVSSRETGGSPSLSSTRRWGSPSLSSKEAPVCRVLGGGGSAQQEEQVDVRQADQGVDHP